MPRIILRIPNQKFQFMADWGVDDENLYVDFSEEYTGTILLVADMVEGDEDALTPFGVPDGETKGRIAFWPQIKEFESIWEKMVKKKQKYMKED